MYHIKPDKRSHKSATAFCESLALLLNRKPYDEISISDICQECGIARTTFYRLFDTVDDILIYQFDGLFEKSLSSYISQPQSDKENSYAKIILNIALSNKPLILAIVSSGRTDLFDFATREKEYTITQNMNLNINENVRVSGPLTSMIKITPGNSIHSQEFLFGTVSAPENKISVSSFIKSLSFP